MLGTRVFKSKEPRGSRVDEALVVGTLGGEKPLHSSTPPSLVRSVIALGWRSELINVWLTTSYLRSTEHNDSGIEHTPYRNESKKYRI